MLEIDTNVRLTARNVLSHEWLSNAMVYANGNRIQENSCKDSDEICKVDSEVSETSLSSNLSSNYAILRRQTHTNDKGSIIQEGKTQKARYFSYMQALKLLNYLQRNLSQILSICINCSFQRSNFKLLPFDDQP